MKHYCLSDINRMALNWSAQKWKLTCRNTLNLQLWIGATPWTLYVPLHFIELSAVFLVFATWINLQRIRDDPIRSTVPSTADTMPAVHKHPVLVIAMFFVVAHAKVISNSCIGKFPIENSFIGTGAGASGCFAHGTRVWHSFSIHSWGLQYLSPDAGGCQMSIVVS